MYLLRNLVKPFFEGCLCLDLNQNSFIGQNCEHKGRTLLRFFKLSKCKDRVYSGGITVIYISIHFNCKRQNVKKNAGNHIVGVKKIYLYRGTENKYLVATKRIEYKPLQTYYLIFKKLWSMT